MTASTSLPVSRERNPLVQQFRALAIVAVVMIHTLPPGIGQVFVRPFINFAVALFLFLSGYLTRADNADWGAFYRKRVVRVLIPYILWSIIYSWPAIKVGDLLTVVTNVFTSKAMGTLYYMIVYIQLALLTPLLVRLGRSRYQWVGWLVAPATILPLGYGGSLEMLDGNLILSPLWLTYYYLGLLLGNGLMGQNYRLRTVAPLYIVAVLAEMGEGYLWFLAGEDYCGFQLKLTSLLTNTLFLLMVYALLRKGGSGLRSRLVRLTGDYSFGIYLGHMMVIMYFGKYAFYSALTFPLNAAFVLLVSLACCLIGRRLCGPRVSGWLGLR